MDEPVRRAWSEPLLIVLVRWRSEEAVLQNCRTGAVGSDAPTYHIGHIGYER